MNTHLIQRAVVLSTMVLIASSMSTLSSHAADQLLTGAMVLAPTEKLGVMASGAVEDSLKECLGRIPTDASPGQRILAEQSCQGEEETRASIQVAPKF